MFHSERFVLIRELQLAIDSALQIRNAALIEMITACQSYVSKYNSQDSSHVCQSNAQQEECDSIVLVALLRQLQRMSIWPGDPKEIILSLNHISVGGLLEETKRMRTYAYPVYYDHYSYNHKSRNHNSCNNIDTLHKSVEEVVEKHKPIVFEMYRQSLENRKEKLTPPQMELTRFQGQ